MAVFTCPNCGARYKVAPDAGGKKVQCKKCQTVSRVPVDESPIPVTDSSDFLAEAASAAEKAGAIERAPDRTSSGASPDPFEDTQALKEAHRMVGAGRRTDTRDPGRSFWSDVGWSFLFISEPNNIVTFVFVWLLYLALRIMPMAMGCLGLAASCILLGWILAFLFNCVAETASGEDDLPKLALTEGLLDGILIPLVKFVGTFAILFLPALLYLLLAVGLISGGLLAALGTAFDPAGTLQDEGMIALPFVILVALGVFLFPIAILIVALSGLGDLFRVDLIARTIARSFLPYLATFVLVVVALELYPTINALIAAVTKSNPLVNAAASGLLGGAIAAYVHIATARIIGLYYRHYKSRFAWTWE